MFFNAKKRKINCKLRFATKYKDEKPSEMIHYDVKKVFKKDGDWNVIRNDGYHYRYPIRDIITICVFPQKGK